MMKHIITICFLFIISMSTAQKVVVVEGNGTYQTTNSVDPAIPNGCSILNGSGELLFTIDFDKVFSNLTPGQIEQITNNMSLTQIITNLDPTEQSALCQAIIDAGCDLTELIDFTQLSPQQRTDLENLIESLEISLFTVNAGTTGVATDDSNGSEVVEIGDIVHFWSADGNILFNVTAGSAIVEASLNPAFVDGLPFTVINNIDLQPTGTPNQFTTAVTWTGADGVQQTTTDPTPITIDPDVVTTMGPAVVDSASPDYHEVTIPYNNEDSSNPDITFQIPRQDKTVAVGCAIREQTVVFDGDFVDGLHSVPMPGGNGFATIDVTGAPNLTQNSVGSNLLLSNAADVHQVVVRFDTPVIDAQLSINDIDLGPETVRNFFVNGVAQTPTVVGAGTQGNPNGPWSSNQNAVTQLFSFTGDVTEIEFEYTATGGGIGIFLLSATGGFSLPTYTCQDAEGNETTLYRSDDSVVDPANVLACPVTTEQLPDGIDTYGTVGSPEFTPIITTNGVTVAVGEYFVTFPDGTTWASDDFEHPDAGYAFCNTEDNLTNGGGGTGPLSTESTFTPHADGNYVFNYSGEVLSGTGGISVGTTLGGTDIFVSAPATGDADGSRLSTTRQSNFTPALALQGGVTYFISQWAGGGGNINNHTVCVADENLGNYIATQVNNAPIPLGWEIGSSIPSSGTVVIEDEHSYLYVQIPDGTTTLDVTGMTVGREFEIRMHPQDNIGDLTISLSDGSNIISDPEGGVNGANSTFTLLGGKNSDQGQVVRFRKMSNGQIWVTNVYPEPSSGVGHADDDVESVIGEHVDNTDPRNPIVKTWIKEECYKKEGAEVLTVTSNLNVVAANITQLQPVSSFSILCKNNGAVAKSLTMNFTAIGAGSIVSSNTLAPGETGFYDFNLGGSFTFVNGTMDPLNDADISMIALPVGSTGAITAAFGPLNGRVVVSSLDDSSSALISKVRTYDDGSTYEVDTDGNSITPITVDPSWELTDCLSSEDEAKVSELANEAIEAYTCELPCTSFDPSGFALQTVPLTPIDYQDGLVETRYLGYFDGGFATATGLAVPQANSFYSTHFNGTDWVIQTNNSPANQVVFTPNVNTYLIARVELGASGASLESFPFECGDYVNGFQTIPQFGGLTISDNTFNGSGNAGELDVSGTWATDITSTVTICEGFNDLNSKLSNIPKTVTIDYYNIPSFIFQNPSTTEVGTTQGGDGISWETVAVGQEFDRVTVLLRNTGAAINGAVYYIQDFDALITVATDPVDIPSGDSYVTFTFPVITVTAPIHANGELNLGSGGPNVFPAQIVIPHTGNGSYSPFFNASNSESWIGSVSLSADDTKVSVSKCSDGSQTAYDSNGDEIPLDIANWTKCVTPFATVKTATQSFTSTNGVEVPVGGKYQFNTDSTTLAIPSAAEYEDFTLSTSTTAGINIVPVTFSSPFTSVPRIFGLTKIGNSAVGGHETISDYYVELGSITTTGFNLVLVDSSTNSNIDFTYIAKQ